jgi:hypothetical protein
MARTRIWTLKSEKPGTESNQFGRPIFFERVGVHLGEQPDQELVIPFGPGHSEAHTTKPKEDPLQV